ncbi:Fuselloviral protein SSV2p33 [Saccharolobus solfataricus]|uniref:Fuselloviral protein SSV2p33 n=1 Tax=Saccharolobus solfataricus TaxID=2287 RepID=A0A157SYP5_SACSO|nr:Fuselloviral protein SSV2p33 [Saccharolobus solfataricus]
MAEGGKDMRWMTNGLTSPKNIRRNSPRFRYNYYDYLTSLQKTKAQIREVNTKPEIHRVVLSHLSYHRLSRKSFCFISIFDRLLHGSVP